MRRRQRRLRSWLRHERMTVAMTLAEMTHHTAGEEVVHDAHDALRGQKTPPPGVRPGSLSDPGPQRSDRTVRRSSGAVPLLAVPVLAGGDGVDGTALSFLVRRAVEDRKREKEEKEKEKARKKKEAQEKADLEFAKRDPWWAQHLADMKAMEERRNKASSSSKRKRKKRRKRRTPRTSSLPGRARRRLRQWFACSAGFTGDDVPCIMFPSGVVRPKMLRIMAGMVQKDSCSGMARLVLLVTVHLVLCFLPSLQARDARHHGRYGPEGLVCWFLPMSLALCSSCCLRPKMPVFMAGMDHRTVWSFTGAVLGQGFLHARCCATCGVMVQTVQYTVWRFRSCSSSWSPTLPVGTQRQIPMVLAVQMTIEIPQLQLIDNVADVLVVHVVQVPQVQVVRM